MRLAQEISARLVNERSQQLVYHIPQRRGSVVGAHGHRLPYHTSSGRRLFGSGRPTAPCGPVLNRMTSSRGILTAGRRGFDNWETSILPPHDRPRPPKLNLASGNAGLVYKVAAVCCSLSKRLLREVDGNQAEWTHHNVARRNLTYPSQ